ncbi:MAG: hypothetical protein JNM30_19215 [Rhodospirillales bacterium]|nr:hypothetical protein [Rhodospirillales bacterium]
MTNIQSISRLVLPAQQLVFGGVGTRAFGEAGLPLPLSPYTPFVEASNSASSLVTQFDANRNRLLQARSGAGGVTAAPQKVFEDRLYVRRAELKIEAAKFAMHLTPQWRAGISAQLDDILETDSWHEEDRLPTVASFRTFLRYATLAKNLRVPRLLVSNAGNVAAAWFNGERRLTIEFLEKDNARVVVSRVTTDGQSENAAYQGPLKRLEHVLAPYEVRDWMTDATGA